MSLDPQREQSLLLLIRIRPRDLHFGTWNSIRSCRSFLSQSKANKSSCYIFCTRCLACSAFKVCLVSCPQVANSTATPHKLGRSLGRFMTANSSLLTTDTFLIYLEIVPSMATLLAFTTNNKMNQL